MPKRSVDSIEQTIWKELAGEALSPSHDRWHVDRVMHFARGLHAVYGGDIEVLEAAVIMHDLGRIDPSIRGEDSIDRSIDHARRILENLGTTLSKKKQDEILLAIREHDKPEHQPSTLEGRILKDADFLAGFGAWGVIRIAMWAGETGGGINQIMDRLETRMRKRVEGLCFTESRRTAIQELSFARLFLSLLNEQPQLAHTTHKGLYVIIEGISGSGKNTLSERLSAALHLKGHTCDIVEEPGEYFKRYRNAWQSVGTGESMHDPLVLRHLMMCDRHQGMKSHVLPLLQSRDVVLSVRSFISTLIYQGTSERDTSELHFVQRFTPIPDLVFVLDLDAEIAFNRISGRNQRGVFESLDQMKRHRQRYIETVECHLLGLNVEVIDASRDLDLVANDCLRRICRVLES